MYIKKILWAIALIGLVIFGYIAYYINDAMFSPNTKFNNEIAYIYISSTDTYQDVKKQLIPLLEDIDTFEALAEQKKYTTHIKPGKYAIEKDMNNNEIINSIRANNLPVKVSFNNQNSLQDLAGRISKQIEADSTSLLLAFTNSQFLSKHQFNKQTALAMYLPNSYELFWNTSAEDFTQRMFVEYNKFWNSDRLLNSKKINLTPVEVITLASIVHEESKQKKEQPRVAGVYLNRLKIGMLLQADPTLKFAAYQLPEYKNKIIKRVLNKHKTIVSPYNTYLNSGLPPGPIAMPDLSAIRAVLNPEKHNYLYFAADPQNIGYHKFAKSLKQHNNNANAYRRYLSKNGINR